MPTAEALTDIKRSPADVFAFLDDLSQAPSWLTSCIELRQTSPGPRGVGTTLHYAYRQGRRPGTMGGLVSAYAPGQSLGMQFSDASFAVEITFDLSPRPEGTQVRHTCRITPRSLMGRLMSPMIQLGNRQQVAHNLKRMRHVLEPGGDSPGRS